MNSTTSTSPLALITPAGSFISSLTLLDFLLPPVLLSLSYALHVLSRPSPPPFYRRTKGHIYRATTSHARFVPKEARHIFSYPVLFYGVDLAELETGKLDMGRWFEWGSRGKWCLTALRPEGYLNEATTSSSLSTSIRERIWSLLASRDIDPSSATEIYMVSMPSYLGFAGINPLTIHFCYAEGRQGGLKVVILEVHNTFGERHVYVLECGKGEDERVPDTWEHRWTIPRAFHVSPFNDRKGFYQVSLQDPLKPSLSTDPPILNLKIVYLVEASSTLSDSTQPLLEKKIYASLSGPSLPLTPHNLLTSLAKWPFTLLLTTPRILYQAMLLHYSKKLDVYPRPEPFISPTEVEINHGEEEGQEIINPVEKGGITGGLMWQTMGEGDRYARDLLVRHVEERLREGSGKEVGGVVIRAADPSVEDIVLPTSKNGLSSTSSSKEGEEERKEILTITYLTPQFYSDLLTAPSIPLALELNNKITKRWRTNNDSLFLSLFLADSTLLSSDSSPLVLSKSEELSTYLRSLALPPSARGDIRNQNGRHPLGSEVSFLLSHFFWGQVGYYVFNLSGAKLVEGTESWSEWDRLFELREEEGKLILPVVE